MNSNNTFPDVIFALGGGGKEMAYHLLEQDWVLEEILRPRPHHAESLSVRVLDTAVDDQNTDTARMQGIRDRRDALLEEYNQAGREAGSLTLDYELLTEGMVFHSATDLTGSREVPAIAEANGMDPKNWWLEPTDIDENLSFARGVFRRRALAKATFFKAYAESQDVRSILNITEPGRVAIFVGLGGGTGSGILPDVIKRVNQECPSAEIAVFGVLSSASEKDTVHKNTAAALCELERMRLSESDPLKNVVLYPIDATRYEGKNGNSVSTTKALEEFDEAFCQSVLAYYGARGEDQFNQAPSFAPFTMAIPQVLEYNIANLEQARTHLTRRVDALVDGFGAESELLDRVSQFYTDAGIDSTSECDLSDEDREYVRDRLAFIESIATENLFTELEYVSAETFCNALVDARSEVDDGDVVALVERLTHYTKGLQAAEQRMVDDLDTLLGAALYAGVDCLKKRITLLERKEAVDDGSLRAQVGRLLRASSGERRDLQNASAELAASIKDYEQRRNRLTESVSNREAEFDTACRKRTKRLENAVETFCRDTEAERLALDTHDLNDVKRCLYDLQSELTTFAETVSAVRTEAELDELERTDVLDTLGAVTDYEERVAGDTVDAFSVVDNQNIIGSMDKLVELRRIHLQVSGSSGLRDRLNPFARRVDRGEAHDRYRDFTNKLGDFGIFTAPPLDQKFRARCKFDPNERVEEIGQQVDDLETAVLEAVDQAALAEVSRHDRHRIETAVGTADVVAVVRSSYENTVPEPTNEELEQLRESVGTVAKAKRRYEQAESAFEDILAGPFGRWYDAHDRAAAAAEKHEQADNSLGTDQSFGYKRTVQPTNIVATVRKDDLGDADILSDTIERPAFTRNLEPLLKNLTKEQYSGLIERRVSGRETNYYGTDVNVGIVAPTVDFDPADHGLATRLATAYGTKGPKGGDSAVGIYSLKNEAGEPIGAPWQFGLTAFISGVFLDNIRAAIEWQQRVTDRQWPDLLHHAYRLEDGIVAERSDYINVVDSEARELYVGTDDAEIRRTLLEDFGTLTPTSEFRAREHSGTTAQVAGADAGERLRGE